MAMERPLESRYDRRSERISELQCRVEDLRKVERSLEDELLGVRDDLQRAEEELDGLIAWAV